MTTKGLRIMYFAHRQTFLTLLVVEWMHFTLLGIILPTIKLKV